MTTRINHVSAWLIIKLSFVTFMLAWASLTQANDVPEPLLLPVGVPETVGLPDHVVAKQLVRVNQRAWRSPVRGQKAIVILS